jgi:hypothetical protein
MLPTEKHSSINNSSDKTKGEPEMNTGRKSARWTGVFCVIATIVPILTVSFTGSLGGEVAE